jgi:Raf kinase inhibitor-like YbhB/YbcL family protein
LCSDNGEIHFHVKEEHMHRLIILVVMLAACSTPAPAPTPIPQPTALPTVLPTATPQPTAIPQPTATPAPTLAPNVVLATLNVTSSTFEAGGSIPTEYSCDGTNISPAIRWGAVPTGTVSFALIMEDADYDNYTHWVLFNIPANRTEIAADVPDGEQLDGIGFHAQNAFSSPGYNGPCPDPKDTHTYTFTLYALNTMLPLTPDPFSPVSKGMVRDAMKGHILGEGILSGTYTRP